MPAPVRRAAPAAPAATRVKIGVLSTYQAGGFMLPPGDYALYFGVRNHAYTRQDGQRGVEMLGVMVTAYPLTGGEAHEQFYSLGKKAIGSYQPDPSTPAHDGVGSTGLIPIPGAPAVNLSEMTNWGQFLKSLYDCGLSEGVFEDDFSSLDGIWVATHNIPEPETRKALGAKTALPGQEQQQDRGPQMIAVVAEIKEDGKPWENGGGMPEGAEAPAAPEPPPAPKAAAKPAARPAAKPAVAAKPAARKPAPAPEPEAVEGDEDVMAAAVEGVGTVLEDAKNAKGCTKVLLRTQTFSAVKKVHGEEMANRVINDLFASDEGVESVVSQLGYGVQGVFVKPVA